MDYALNRSCFLVLEDGSVYPGSFFGAEPPTAADLHKMDTDGGGDRGIGEVVFNTGMTGYYEILTDPSYTGQIVAMTYPHIGNYGVDEEWSETAEERGVVRPAIKASGMVIRSLYQGTIPSGRTSLDEVLKRHGTPGITGVDTRRLTLRIREGGSPLGVIVRSSGKVESSSEAGLSSREIEACTDFLSRYPKMEGRNLVPFVGTAEGYETGAERMKGPGQGGKAPADKQRIAVIDYGIKANILREVRRRGFAVAVFPGDIDDPALILGNTGGGSGGRETSGDSETATGRRGASAFSGVLLSNGPGDPAVLKKQISFVEKLLGKLPVCGICLGHQLIALAMGAKTFKMKFGHHGLNHPVRDEESGRVFVTSQNHGFSVDGGSLPDDTRIRFINANDRTVEGIENRSLSVMTAQFHPEAAPGPFDSRWIFDEFFTLMTGGAEFAAEGARKYETRKGGSNAG